VAKHVTHTATSSWLSLDAWSETYIGAHWLVTSELPNHHYQTQAHHGPLSQMVLLAAHQLVEIIFFQCVKSVIDNSQKQFIEIEKTYSNASFGHALDKWPETITGGHLI